MADDLIRNELLTVSYDDYNADRSAVRKGWLDYIDITPAHLWAHLNAPEEERRSDALDFGQLIHCFVLEPDLVVQRYYREPPGDRRTKVVQEALKQARAENPGKLGFRPEKYDMGILLRDAVYRHPGARKLLGYDGGFERAIFWRNDDTGEDCKCRYDFVSERGAFAVDVKTAEDASEDGFGRAVWTYRYDVQASHYTEPNDLRFVFVVIEKKPPYAVALYAATDEVLTKGHGRRMPNLRTYAECRASGEWPGYGNSIRPIRLPRWAR